MKFYLELMHLLYWMRGLILEIAGCEVFEDLSAICDWGTYNVPW